MLVLSEYTGAADQLTQAVLVNPHDIDGMKDKIITAVKMNEAEQEKRMRRMNRHLKVNDVTRWSEVFLAELAEISATTSANAGTR